MPTESLREHYDGERIRLDEPVDLAPDVPLLVTVLASEEDHDREAWAAMARQMVARAFGSDEPDYGVADVKR
jgi:hypothetical protein